ncbi:uncharacterized protein [Henckelia pumila]|uniref:uncharacterized protein n=1 Tax=Henckelia pumila TaxID=405737 RepID=UPI003C6E9AA1
MAEDTEEPAARQMMDYVQPMVLGNMSSITKPRVQANTFEIKPAIIQMIQTSVQFGGSATDDPNAHIANFLELCGTFKQNGVTDDAIRLRLFPFSLRDKAKSWLNSLPTGSITTWEMMTKAFLSKYFPPSKTAKMRNDITNFVQHDTETLYEAWEHFKKLLRRCPHHGLPVWIQVQIFYNGLFFANRSTIDATSGGTIMRKTPEEAYELLEDIASHTYQWQSDRNIPKRPAGVHQIDEFTTIFALLEGLNKKIDSMIVTAKQVQTITCNLCGGNHHSTECQVGNPFQLAENANFVGNMPPNNPYSNTYNPGWKNHPNFSWSNQNQNLNQQNVMRPPLGFAQQDKKPSLEDLMTNFISSTETRLQNQDASIRNLETQLGQLANIISGRTQGTFPSDTEKNPKEKAKAITLRSGKEIGLEIGGKEEKNEQENKESEKGKPSITKPSTPPKQVSIPPPFLAALKKAKVDASFAKFLEVFKKLHINILFADALFQMPSYAKFLKDILSEKRKLEEYETVNLTEECSAIVQNKLPPKLKDPGRLGLGEPKPTTVSLQLADRFITYPRGIIEDVLVKVDKFIFPVDFLVLDMDEDIDMPLILGRPFLATGKALIDVQMGKLILRVGEDQECLEGCLLNPKAKDEHDEEKSEIIAQLHSNPTYKIRSSGNLGELGQRDIKPQKPSIEDPPTLELKPLPSHLKYAYLNSKNSLSVIISSSLTGTNEEKLLRILREHKKAFRWKIADIKGISPSICMHKILMEEKYSPVVQPRRCLNPKMQEVVKTEVI